MSTRGRLPTGSLYDFERGGIEHAQAAKPFYRKHSRVEGEVLITDLRGVREIPPSNRFLVYSLFPESNISIRLIDGKGGEFVAFSVGYSILNRTASVDVGSLMLRYGGGGHKAVGTCQVPNDQADQVLKELIQACSL